MLTLHLFKRQANKRGIFLLTLFCVYAMVLMIPAVRGFSGSDYFWLTGQSGLILMILLSLVTPVVSLIKPGFSYKGHPGVRHVGSAVAGSLILIICFTILMTNFLSSSDFLSKHQLILYSLVYPLHGMHCLAVYGSLFKGPTSKFGKVYQPYLPIIE